MCSSDLDPDTVCLSNLNRQIIATRETVGRYKAEVMRERILSINPAAKVRVHKCFFLPGMEEEIPFEAFDYIVDAVDTVAAKIALATEAQKRGIPLISSMGTGNKLCAGRFRVADLYETRVCPLARVMRRELKRRGIEKLKVVYSEEEPVRPVQNEQAAGGRRSTPGSMAFVPPVAGLLAAGEVVRDLIVNKACNP